ncbi:MAG: alanine dehydrogenase, partial [Elusimicrobia bacterium]|nr:alanine dehydrogenase [Elusimicrobiota bacterium]
MKIGVPKEIKNREHRVGLVPGGARALVKDGHRVFVEKGAGLGSGITDEEYKAAGATIVADKKKLFDDSDMIVKVKEPLESEYSYFHEGQILYTYLHLAPDPEQTKDLIASGAICIAYETVTSARGGLPLLAP